MARPIRTITVTSHYIRAFRKLPAPIQKRLVEQERLFKANAENPKLHTHRLKGKLKRLWSYSVDYSHRILFEFTGPDSSLYHDVGPHDIYG